MNSADLQNGRPAGLNNAELVNQDSFERLRSKNRRKEIRRRIFYTLVALLLIAAVGIVCVVLFFNLRTVEIRGNSHYTDEEILDACGFTPTTNLFGIDFEGHPDLRRIFLDKDFVGYPLRKDFTHPEIIRRPV